MVQEARICFENLIISIVSWPNFRRSVESAGQNFWIICALMNRWSSMREMHGCPEMGTLRAIEWLKEVESKCVPLMFPSSKVGVAGGMQVLEPANANMVTEESSERQVNCTVCINPHDHKCRRLGLPQTSESIECRHGGVYIFSPYLLIFAPFWGLLIIWYSCPRSNWSKQFVAARMWPTRTVSSAMEAQLPLAPHGLRTWWRWGNRISRVKSLITIR